MPEILEIRMQSYSTDCTLCGKPTECHWGVPTINGDVVSNRFPDAIYSEHGGSVPVCERCFRMHEDGKIPTFDRYYFWMGMMQEDGSGI